MGSGTNIKNISGIFLARKQRNKEPKKQRTKETKKQRNKETKKQRNKETKKQRNIINSSLSDCTVPSQPSWSSRTNLNSHSIRNSYSFYLDVKL